MHVQLLSFHHATVKLCPSQHVESRWTATREKQKTGSSDRRGDRDTKATSEFEPFSPGGPLLDLFVGFLSVDPILQTGHAKMFENSLRFGSPPLKRLHQGLERQHGGSGSLLL